MTGRILDIVKGGLVKRSNQLWIMASLLPCFAGCSFLGQEGTDEPEGRVAIQGPFFRASEILPANIIQGANYNIESQVPVIDDRFMFRIRTRYGIISAHGFDMLELRLREMYSLQVAERLRQEGHVSAGILDGLTKTGQGFEELLNDPAGVLRRAPQGLSRMVHEGLDPADRRAGNLYRRQLAAYVQCDPETSNPILKKWLDEMAIKQTIGNFMTGAALGAVLPGMGLLSTTTEIKQMVTTMAPHEIVEVIEGELTRMGIAPSVGQFFCRETRYTTTQRLLFLTHLRRLYPTGGLQSLVEDGNAARTESEELGVLHAVVLWAQMHRQQPIRQFFQADTPAAELQNGSVVVLQTVDYLTNVQPSLATIREYRQSRPKSAAFLYITGTVSSSVREALQAAQVKLAERGNRPG